MAEPQKGLCAEEAVTPERGERRTAEPFILSSGYTENKIVTEEEQT